ncbi:hypothetical protein Tco_0857257 [Tanacetum coccineum]|uniref:Uncharacterized protein n=1 Tax=Tanacetum coccineum TaxID=301880 RepID=A0ABQ5B5P7_9ASTR
MKEEPKTKKLYSSKHIRAAETANGDWGKMEFFFVEGFAVNGRSRRKEKDLWQILGGDNTSCSKAISAAEQQPGIKKNQTFHAFSTRKSDDEVYKEC